MKQYFMGIDIGTYESKGVIIGSDCRVVSFSFEKHELINPKPGYFEHDAEKTWWGDFCTLSKRLINESGIDPKLIRCVGLSALGCDCLPVDENLKPLTNAILYGIDCRSANEIDYLNKLYGNRVKEIFGHEICSSDIAPKILWIKNNLPEIYKRAAKFLTGSSYLCAKLTGKYTIDKYLAEDFAPLYNLGDNSISNEFCSMFCRPDQLADIKQATDIAGTVTAEAARQTGLSFGTDVLVGTGDSGAEAVSTGVFCPGDVMIQMGSSCYFICLCDRLITEPRMWPGTFIIPEVFAVCAGTNTAGTLTRWFRDELYHELIESEQSNGKNAYAEMAGDIEKIPAGSEGLICLPYFAGERTPLNDPFAKGMFFGLTLSHTRAHLYKAALEGIGYTIAQHFDIFEENSLPVKKIMAVGGGTKNKVWLQAVADILGRTVYTSKITFGAAYGDAIMAALSGGAYSSWEELSKMIEPDLVIEPNMAAHIIYSRQKQIFSELYNRNKDLMHEFK
ncbi:xylulokinase [Ruminiclostridium sufflavum DSM 19573]|uniref:Xylulokinase n=1 Tax=Ruminiclostridium sufflavum DSM 19573 TaxID=1121337 RepID=A0A318XJ85_9FIRM|nr:FGGY-family carbohydrate kinase [Ruminiclostridium sufflavum]PYG85913.1 xylulokinase [Ruminiclostridium sufflavum DSM 19573]